MHAVLPAPASAAAHPQAFAPLPGVVVRDLGRTDYEAALARMRAFSAARDVGTQDEIWLTEHDPVYTLGLAGRREHVLDAGTIPVVQSDRGGQVTWHGPGQLVAYLLLDLNRRGIRVREMVDGIEEAVIGTLRGFGVAGVRRAGMPGVYVGEAKIAALGLKVSRGRSYHGLSLNVDCDLAPFGGINPCGYAGLAATSLAALGAAAAAADVGAALAHSLKQFIEAHQ